MPGLPFEPKIILEPYKKGDGRTCTSCGEVIPGMMYAGVIEFMETKFDDMEGLNMIVCEECKKKFQNDNI